MFIIFEESMPIEDMKILQVTEKESDIIFAIRNFKSSYPNGSREQEWYIMNLLDELMDID